MHLIVMLALFFIPVNAMDNNHVTIRTQDGYMGIAKRYAREMKIFQACSCKNRYFLCCKKDEVNILIDAIQEAKKNKLKKFLTTQSEDQRKTLLSAAYTFQATDLLTLCTWHILLPDVRKNISAQLAVCIKDSQFYETMDRRIVEGYYDRGHSGIADKTLCSDGIACPDQTKSVRLKLINRWYCLEVCDTEKVLYELNVPCKKEIDHLCWKSNDLIYAQYGSHIVCEWDVSLGQKALSELDFLQWVFLYGLYQRVLSSPYEQLVLHKNSLKCRMYKASPIFPDDIRKWIEQYMLLQVPVSSGGCECSIS